MNDREYRALKDTVRYVKKQRGENPFYASTHSKGKVIINDKNVYATDKDFHKEDSKNTKKSMENHSDEVPTSADQMVFFWKQFVNIKRHDRVEVIVEFYYLAILTFNSV